MAAVAADMHDVYAEVLGARPRTPAMRSVTA
jgi:hypothetical protein